MRTTDPSELSIWSDLDQLARTVGQTSIRSLIAHQDRSGFIVHAAGITMDFARQRVDDQVVHALIELAQACGIPEARASMVDGAHINVTEDRAVGHMALRMPRDGCFVIDGHDVVADVHRELDAMAEFAEGVRHGRILGASGQRFRTIINIGIGGSDLGPAMAYDALREYADPALRLIFVSNVDPTDISRALTECDPATTLVIVSSKTFTTSETMANARAARAWLANGLGEAAIAQHMVAISTNHQAIADFGIERSFGFWDWVGGRYSMDSSIGLSTMIAIGPANFRRMLDGFHAMDVHFLTAPPRQNMPLLMGLIDVWNRNFLRIPTVAVLPYSQALSRFPAYLQQLVMESNGKSVRRDGASVTYDTAAVYWGEPGTNGQHSFFQLLHQGTSEVACQILCFARNGHEIAAHHDLLIANALAQATVLALGRTQDEVPDHSPHKVMPGNRPTTVLWAVQCDPFTLGALIALYEHAVFVQAAIWGINAFDQWGVELGKTVAKTIVDGLDDPANTPVDRVTQASMEFYRQLRNG